MPERLSIDIEIPAGPETDSAAGPALLSPPVGGSPEEAERAPNADLPGRISLVTAAKAGGCEHACPAPSPGGLRRLLADRSAQEWKDLRTGPARLRRGNVDALSGVPSPRRLALRATGPRPQRPACSIRSENRRRPTTCSPGSSRGPSGGGRPHCRPPRRPSPVQAIESRHPRRAQTRLTLHRVWRRGRRRISTPVLNIRSRSPSRPRARASRGHPGGSRRRELAARPAAPSSCGKIPGGLSRPGGGSSRRGGTVRASANGERHADERRLGGTSSRTQAACGTPGRRRTPDLLARRRPRHSGRCSAPRGRAPLFTPGGKWHVTSLILRPRGALAEDGAQALASRDSGRDREPPHLAAGLTVNPFACRPSR